MPRPSAAPGREVELIVVDGAGRLLGRLPDFTVGTPWWQDLEPIVERHPDLVVLRLLHGESGGEGARGGRVSYLVEAGRPPRGLVPLAPGPQSATGEEAVAALLTDHPLRMPWARPGGPGEDLAWAERHAPLNGPPRQMRSWNLSSIWALPTRAGTAWLKSVPPFFSHEAPTIQGLGPSPHLPRLIAAEGQRLLMEEMPGTDGYGAGPDDYAVVITALLELQSGVLAAPDGIAPRVPHWAPTTMGRAAAQLIEDRRHQLNGGSGANLTGDPVRALERLLADWPDRWERISECGLPDVVFHGDLHPGNARLGLADPVIFDWGDSGWGHPLLDLAVVSAYQQDGSLAARAAQHWLEGWRSMVPGSDPARAWALLRPVARLRAALVFQNFVDNIEPSERVYHDSDVPTALAGAARATAGAD